MNTEQNGKGNSPEHKTGKKSRKFLKFYLPAAILILLVVVILLTPVILSSGFAEELILKKVNSSISGEADFSNFSIGWLKGISLTDLSFRDDAGVANVNVKSITTSPEYLSLLVGKLALDDTVINQPVVEIDLTKQISKTGGKRKTGKKKVEPAPQETQKNGKIVPISRLDLKINNGKLSVKDAKNSIECSAVNTGLQLDMPHKSVNFAVDMDINGEESSLSASGDVEDKDDKGWKLDNITGWVNAEVNNLDLEKLAPLLELAKVDAETDGVLSADVKGEFTGGKLKKFTADANIEDAYIKPAALEGDYISSKKLDLRADIIGADGYLNINKLNFSADWAEVNATGRVPELGKLSTSLGYDSEFALDADYNFDVAELSTQLSGRLGLEDKISIKTGELAGKIQTTNLNGIRQVVTRNQLKNVSAVKEGDTITLDETVSLNADIESSPAGITYNKIELKSSFAGLQCSGTNKKLDYNFSADTDAFQNRFGKLTDFGKYEVRGQFTGEGTIESVNSAINCTGKIDYRNIGLTSPWQISEPAGSIAYNISAKPGAEKPVLDVSKLDVNTSFARLGVTSPFKINLLRPTEELNVPIDIKTLDLNTAQSVFGDVAGIPEGVELHGIAEGQVEVGYDDTTLTVKTTPVNIKDFKVVSTGKKPFYQKNVSLNANAKLELRRKTFRVGWKLTSPQIKLEGDITNEKVKPGTNKIEGRADYEFDWEKVSAGLGQFIPEGLEIKGKVDDTLTFSSVYPANAPASIPANLNADAKLSFDSADYMGLQFQATTIPCTFDSGVMEIHKFSSVVNNGRLNFAAKADFSKQPTILKTPEPMQIADAIQINQQTTRSMLMYLNPLFADAVSAEGTANLRCERLAIPLKSKYKSLLQIDGNVSVDARLVDSGLFSKILTVAGSGSRSGNIKIHPTDFVLEDGVLRYENMRVDVESKTVYFDGKTGLDKSLDMRITIPLNDGSDSVTLPIKGTLEQPKLDIEDLLKGEIEKQIKKGLRDLFE